MQKSRERQSVGNLTVRQARHARRRQSHPVVGVIPRQDLHPVRLPLEDLVLPDDFQGGLVGLRTRITEHRIVEIPGSHLSQSIGQPHGRLGRGIEKAWIERQLLHLLGHRFHNLLPPIPHIHAPQTGQTVQEPSLFPLEIHPLAFRQDMRPAGMHGRMVREGMQMVLPVHFSQLLQMGDLSAHASI